MALKNPSANCFRKFKGLQLTFQVVSLIIDDEMQCEAKEPAHGRLVPRRPALADLMTGNAAVMTDG